MRVWFDDENEYFYVIILQKTQGIYLKISLKFIRNLRRSVGWPVGGVHESNGFIPCRLFPLYKNVKKMTP